MYGKKHEDKITLSAQMSITDPKRSYKTLDFPEKIKVSKVSLDIEIYRGKPILNLYF